MKVAALLLAAGAGRRMRLAEAERANAPATPNKLLLEYCGVPMVCHVAKTAQTSRCDALYVVVGSANEELRQALSGQCERIVENADWASGLASSIRAGVTAIASERPAFDALVVLLADQPRVTSAHINALLDAFGHATEPLVASHYAGIDGVPALFPRRCFDALSQLTGDEGARSLLAAERASARSASSTRSADAADANASTLSKRSPVQPLIAIPFEPAAVDIDTPEDYAALRS